MSFVAFLFVFFVVAFSSPASAQGKKIYISVDMEGISGVVGDDQTSEGGATEVVVNDSHGSQRNLLPEDLDPRVDARGLPHHSRALPLHQSRLTNEAA